MSSRNGCAIVGWRSSERAVFDLPPDVLGKLLVIAPLIGVARVVAARRGMRVLWGAAMALVVVRRSRRDSPSRRLHALER